MEENTISKIKNIIKKKKVNIFISKKSKRWSSYVCDTITSIFQNKEIYYDICKIPNCDIIITNICNRPQHYSKNALNIIISGESRMATQKYDISISTIKNFNSHINIYTPLCYLILKELKQLEQLEQLKNDIKARNKFCAFLYSGDYTHRNNYFNLLSKYKKVDGLGKSCNNIKREFTRNLYNENITYLDESIKIYSDYKFVLAIENKLVDGYNTEKIITPLLANSIPIYWGSDSIFNYINKKRVIYILDFSSNDDLLNYIKKVNENDTLYNSIISENIFLKNKEPNDIFSEFENGFRNIIIK